jgi:hypothetical protein
MSRLIISKRLVHTTVHVAALCALAGLASSALAAGGKGLTFGVYSHDAVLGIDYVANGDTGNPYTGDTSCTRPRPVLCIKVDGSARPNYAVTAGGEYYAGWVEGHFATTKPVKGNTLTSAADGTALCVAQAGAGWRMAEFHDPVFVPGMSATALGNSIGSTSPWPAGAKAHGAWTMRGYSHLRNDVRFWVHVSDQQGNCWNP